MTQKSNAKGLLPLLFFLVIYIFTGIATGNFGAMPLLVGFMAAFGVALCLDRLGEKTSFDDKVMLFSRAGGEETIILMVVIFLLAGAFYSVADAMGAVSSIVNLGLSAMPSNMILPGLFLIGCVLSFSMGTSMGTVTALAPIGVGIVEQTGANMPLVMATVIGGAMFGDNLSFISDTTIAAVRTQDVSLRDKFKMNGLIILPAVICTVIILAMIPISSDVSVESGSYSLVNIIPYAAIIITALIGWNVMAVLGVGIGLGVLVGLFNGSFNLVEMLGVLQRGMGWMENLAIIAIVVGGLVGLMKYYGGIDYLLKTVTSMVKGKIGGQFGIGALVSLITVSTTNNTISILAAGPLAKDISAEYDIDPTKTAALLDIFAAGFQGLLPYGGQLLLAAGLAKISPVEIMPYGIYQILMIVFASLAIFLGNSASKNKPTPAAEA
nr:Na+/H+ antiporter NhaC family protein [uncultured Cohaesibacter sp.]